MRGIMLALALALPAAAGAETYLGLHAGEFRSDACAGVDACDADTVSGGAILGYRPRSDLAVELQAVRLGQISVPGIDTDVWGLGAHALLGGPATERVTAFVMGGAVRWRAKAGGAKAYGTDPYVGLVVAWRATDAVTMRLQYQRYLDVLEADIDAVTVAVTAAIR